MKLSSPQSQSPLLALILGCLSKTILSWINKHHKPIISCTGPSSSAVIKWAQLKHYRSVTGWAAQPLLPQCGWSASLAALSGISTRWQQLLGSQPGAPWATEAAIDFLLTNRVWLWFQSQIWLFLLELGFRRTLWPFSVRNYSGLITTNINHNLISAISSLTFFPSFFWYTRWNTLLF